MLNVTFPIIDEMERHVTSDDDSTVRVLKRMMDFWAIRESETTFSECVWHLTVDNLLCRAYAAKGGNEEAMLSMDDDELSSLIARCEEAIIDDVLMQGPLTAGGLRQATRWILRQIAKRR